MHTLVQNITKTPAHVNEGGWKFMRHGRHIAQVHLSRQPSGCSFIIMWSKYLDQRFDAEYKMFNFSTRLIKNKNRKD